MFSRTLLSTGSWPHTSLKRVLISPRLYVSMPPMKKMPKKMTRLKMPYIAVRMSVPNSGSPVRGVTKSVSKMRPGASAMASQNDTPHFQASSRPRIVRPMIHLKVRFIRYRRHGLTLSILRFQAPQTCFSQNWLYRGDVLADEVVDLAEDLETEEADQPPLGAQLVLEGLPVRHDRDLRVQVGGREREEDRDQDQHLEAIADHHLHARLRLAVVDVRHVDRGYRWGRRREHAHLTTFHDVAISLMACWLSLKHSEVQPMRNT